jgi:hypothetical protein
VIDIDTPRRRRRRPRAVSFVGSLLCFEALLLLAIGAFDVLSQGDTQPADLDIVSELVRHGTDLIQVRIPVLTVLLGASMLVAGVGLLRMYHWAWLLAMIIEASSLAIALRWYVGGEPRFGPMALSSLIVLVLNQHEVRQAFIHEHPKRRVAGAEHPAPEQHAAG